MEKAPEVASYSSGTKAADSSQPAIIAFLSDPKSYPEEAESVSRIETHAAIVFLTGDRAYKLKRAVKLPYLDFSTLDKRRAVIERELEINSRASPELYLSILPVTRSSSGDGFELGGTGEAADWLLVMRRFDQGALLDSLACKGQLDLGLAVELAYTIEHFHRQALRATSAQFAQSLDRIAADLETALSGSSAQSIGLHPAPYIKRLRGELGTRKALIEEREREGFVRRCHGDLHLRNIVLWEGRPRLFDAIEFDEQLATIDVLYDLAFLMMDLWYRGLNHQANVILNHYFQRAAISELMGLALLPLFLSVRAAIRAMTGLHALAVRGDAGQEAHVKEILSYAKLAEALLAPPRASLIAVGGISGTGKTSVGREVAPFIGAAPGALHIRTDVERKVMQGVALDRPLPRDSYTLNMRDEVYRRVFKKAEVALNGGHSVLVDAVFPEESQRTLLCELAQRTGAAFWGFWLEADASTIRERIATRSGDASDADISIAEMQLETVNPPHDWIRIGASGTVNATASAILKTLEA